MVMFGRRSTTRLGLIAALLALLTFAPTASAQDEPALVFPCADGAEWEAAPGQPIEFGCGWGVQGGPGLIEIFLNAYQATLIVENEQGDPVLTIDPAGIATLWGDPQSGPSGFEDATCAGPTGRGVFWSYLLEAGLPEGTYSVSFVQSVRHPVNDGFHTCWFEDGTRVASPPSRFSGSVEAVSTLIVED